MIFSPFHEKEIKMQIQPVTNQPNFNGKLIFKERAGIYNKYSSEQISKIFNNINDIVSSKPYDIFVWSNKEKPDFYNVAANKSFEEAKRIKEYTVKVHSNAMIESLVDATKDAVKMYEKYISKGIKG